MPVTHSHTITGTKMEQPNCQPNSALKATMKEPCWSLKPYNDTAMSYHTDDWLHVQCNSSPDYSSHFYIPWFNFLNLFGRASYLCQLSMAGNHSNKSSTAPLHWGPWQGSQLVWLLILLSNVGSWHTLSKVGLWHDMFLLLQDKSHPMSCLPLPYCNYSKISVAQTGPKVQFLAKSSWVRQMMI